MSINYVCKNEEHTEFAILCKKTYKECVGFFATDGAQRIKICKACPLYRDYPQYKIKKMQRGN